MKNKRGIEIAISTFVIIVIAVSVMLLLLFWLNHETRFFTDFLNNFRSKSNVDEVIDSCNALVMSERFYSYCCDLKEIRIGEQELEEMTCNELREQDFISKRIEFLNCEEINCIE